MVLKMNSETKASTQNEKIAWSLGEIAEQSSRSRTALYKDISDGHLETIRIGRRRLITNSQRQKYIEYINSLGATGA